MLKDYPHLQDELLDYCSLKVSKVQLAKAAALEGHDES